MAARRLIVLMLVLLFASSLVVALSPVRPPDEGGTSTSTESTTTTTDPAAKAGDAGLVRATISATAKRPATVRAGTGDQLQLRVEGRRTATVVIPRLGASDGLTPFFPAHFDLLLAEPGSYRVELLESRDAIGTIRVREPGGASG